MKKTFQEKNTDYFARLFLHSPLSEDAEDDDSYCISAYLCAVRCCIKGGYCITRPLAWCCDVTKYICCCGFLSEQRFSESDYASRSTNNSVYAELSNSETESKKQYDSLNDSDYDGQYGPADQVMTIN